MHILLKMTQKNIFFFIFFRVCLDVCLTLPGAQKDATGVAFHSRARICDAASSTRGGNFFWSTPFGRYNTICIWGGLQGGRVSLRDVFAQAVEGMGLK